MEKKVIRTHILNTFDYLLDFGYFTHEELMLVIGCWGDNEETYRLICHYRFALDQYQMAEEDDVYIVD